MAPMIAGAVAVAARHPAVISWEIRQTVGKACVQSLEIDGTAIDALGKRYCCSLPRLCVIYIDLEAEYDVPNLLSPKQTMHTGSTPAC